MGIINKLAASASKKTYTGKFPTIKLVKNNSQAKKDACKWAIIIAKNKSFHYGHGKHAHHNGCYYCGTQKLKKGHGIKKYITTYCCNPFVGAAWAHGAGDATALRMCQHCNSWDFGTGNGSYEKSDLFKNLGHPAKSKLKAGDVLCSSNHVMLYVGDGKVAEASGGDDNKVGSEEWNDSIHVIKLTDKRYKSFTRVYRYKGSVNVKRPLKKGEYSERVRNLRRFLKWYGCDITVGGFYNTATVKAVKKFQKAEGLKVTGIVDEKDIEKMKAVRK